MATGTIGEGGTPQGNPDWRNPAQHRFDETARQQNQAWDTRADELEAARGIYQGRNYIGSAQADLGIAQASQAGLQRGTGRGSSPLARRAGVYGAAGAQQQAAAQGAEAAMQERGSRNQAWLEALDRRAGYRHGDQQEATKRFLGEQAHHAGEVRRQQEQEAQDRADDYRLAGAVMGAIGSGASMFAASDEHLKQGRPIGEVDAVNMETMRHTEPKLWRYKDGAQRELGLTSRVQAGPTAQNLEETPLGKTIVYDTPHGKVVDTKAATLQLLGQNSTLMRTLDDQSERLERLESGRG